MRSNQYIAQATGISRRKADALVSQGRVTVDGQVADLGSRINEGQQVLINNQSVAPTAKAITIMLNKSAGYVCSRNGQGSPTIYELLPAEYHHLKPVGRLDKDSSGLLLMTNDGELANRLTHPRYGKEKVYEIGLDRPLTRTDLIKLASGVAVEGYISRLKVKEREGHNTFEVRLSEGKNRQIRRTFTALGYAVTRLHRTHFGKYELGSLKPGRFRLV